MDRNDAAGTEGDDEGADDDDDGAGLDGQGGMVETEALCFSFFYVGAEGEQF